MIASCSKPVTALGIMLLFERGNLDLDDPGVATVVSFDPETCSAGIIFSNSPTISFKGQKIFYQEMMKKLLR
jgi:hypothetical protein